MDGKRFDDLTRIWSRGFSRRRAIGPLAASGLGGWLALAGRARAAAQEATVSLGGTCTASSQCRNDGMGSAPYCGDNGIVADGPLTCCRESGCCGSDADCCGGRLCAPSGDVCSYCAYPPFPDRFPGDECTSSAQCVASVTGTVICADNGVAEDGPLNCCYDAGSICYDGPDSHCCSGTPCIDGICGGGEFRRTFRLGAACTSSDQCSQADGPAICADNGIVDDGPLNCCRVAGGVCAGGAECCGSLLCTGGVCQ